MMLRLLLLALLLTVKADKSDRDGSGDGFLQDDDEEQGDEQERMQFGPHVASEVKNDPEDIDNEEGNITFIIIAAVSVVALAIVAVIAVVLFRRHLKRREQGVYSVPVEQGQKGV